MPTKIIDDADCSWGEGRLYQEIVFDEYWSKRTVLKLFGVYAGKITIRTIDSVSFWDKTLAAQQVQLINTWWDAKNTKAAASCYCTVCNNFTWCRQTSQSIRNIRHLVVMWAPHAQYECRFVHFFSCVLFFWSLLQPPGYLHIWKNCIFVVHRLGVKRLISRRFPIKNRTSAMFCGFSASVGNDRKTTNG